VLTTYPDTLREIDSRLPIATKAPQNGVHFAQDNTPKSQQHQHQQEEQQPKVNADAPNAAWYFFYGTLKDPELLRELLELTQTPRLTPARIHGYNVKYFGVYPATVRADVADLAQPGMFAPSVFLDGAAWFVPTAEAAWSLRQHEDKHYKDTAVEIEFKDKPGVLGRMFEWNAEAKLLTDNPAI
jgi:hypothetical protein